MSVLGPDGLRAACGRIRRGPVLSARVGNPLAGSAQDPLDGEVIGEEAALAVTEVLEEAGEKFLEQTMEVQDRSWNLEGHASIAVWPEIVDQFVELPAWASLLPTFSRRALYLATRCCAPNCWDAVDWVSARSGVALDRVVNIRFVFEQMGVVCLRWYRWARAEFGVEPLHLVGWKVVMGRTLPGDFILDKSNKPFSARSEVARVAGGKKNVITADEWVKLYSAAQATCHYAPRQLEPFEKWIANPMNYGAKGVLGLKAQSVNGKATRLLKPGLMLAMTPLEVTQWMLAFKELTATASIKQDRDNPRVIYVADSRPYLAWVYLKQRVGAGPPSNAAYGWDALDVAARLEELGTSGLVLDSSDISGFDGSVYGDQNAAFVQASVSTFEHHIATSGGATESDRMCLDVLRKCKNQRVFVRETTDGKPSTVQFEVAADHLVSGVAWTSECGTETSGAYNACSAVVANVGRRVGGSNNAGDDNLGTATNVQALRALQKGYKSIGVELHPLKSLAGVDFGVFLMLYWLVDHAGKPQARVAAGALIERNPESASSDLFGFAQLQAIVASVEEWFARAGGTVDQERACERVMDLWLPELCRSWHVPVALLSVPTQCNGLGYAPRPNWTARRPPTAKSISSNPFMAVPTDVAGRVLAAIPASADVPGGLTSRALQVVQDYLSIQVVSQDLSRERVRESKEAERAHVFNLHPVGDLASGKAFAAARVLVVEEVKRLIGSGRPLRFAQAQAKVFGKDKIVGDEGSRMLYDGIVKDMTAAEQKEVFLSMFKKEADRHKGMLDVLHWSVWKAVWYDGIGAGVDCSLAVGGAWKVYIGAVLTRSLRVGLPPTSRSALKQLSKTDLNVWCYINSAYMREQVRAHLWGVHGV